MCRDACTFWTDEGSQCGKSPDLSAELVFHPGDDFRLDIVDLFV